jgi:hypothetical protein
MGLVSGLLASLQLGRVRVRRLKTHSLKAGARAVILAPTRELALQVTTAPTMCHIFNSHCNHLSTHVATRTRRCQHTHTQRHTASHTQRRHAPPRTPRAPTRRSLRRSPRRRTRRFASWPASRTCARPAWWAATPWRRSSRSWPPTPTSWWPRRVGRGGPRWPPGRLATWLDAGCCSPAVAGEPSCPSLA